MKKLLTILLMLSGVSLADEDFKRVEIRVVRDRYFQKSLRPELGLGVYASLNKPYLQTVMAQAGLAFYPFEILGIGVDGGLSGSFNKEVCYTLGREFSIEPVITPLQWVAGGKLELAPIYGKYQLPSGDVLYFDWLFKVGAGRGGIYTRKQGCRPAQYVAATDNTNTAQVSVMEYNASTGQRFFLNKNIALQWNILFYLVEPYPVDGYKPGFGDYDQILFLSLGASYFFR
jgi:hypothetical protein